MNVTVADSFDAIGTRAKPINARFGRTTDATSSVTYSWTTSSPARSPVFVTVTRTVIGVTVEPAVTVRSP